MDQQILDTTVLEKEMDRYRDTMLKPYEGSWVHNIPFFLVPVSIVLGFRGNTFTPEEFYKSGIWNEPGQWNAGFVKDGNIVIFMYGFHHRLERYLYAERIGADRSFQSYGNKVWELAIAEAERLAREKSCKYVWTTTFRRGEVRKFLESTTGVELNPSSMTVLKKKL